MDGVSRLKLVTFDREGSPGRIGLLQNNRVIDILQGLKAIGRARGFPLTMLDLLEQYRESRVAILENLVELATGPWVFDLRSVRLRAPIPRPRSFRDFYAFEQHVKAVRSKHGSTVIPEWYEMPVFYFSNHNAITGPEDVIEFPPSSVQRDFELEVGAVLCKEGKNVAVEEAEGYLAGLYILNDWSARDIQEKETKLIGPAKSKDFATSIGPWLVTLDELEDKKTAPGKYDLVMTARVNGKECSRANLKDIYWSFCDMVSFASRDTTVYPGEILGSGTAATGCILELGPEKQAWLKTGDVVELEIERLGILTNVVR